MCHNRPENGHFGITNTARKMQERFYFPHMYVFVTARVNNCLPCIQKRLKPGKKTHKMHREELSYFGQRVYIDVVGPLKASTYKGHKYCHFLTMQDGFTRYLVAVPIKDTTTATVVDAIIEQWVYKFGCMEVIHTDRASNFVSDLFQAVMKKLGVVKTITPPYSPEGDRVERAHRVLGDIIRSDQSHDAGRWAAKLPAAVMAYNGSFNRVIGVSPYEAVYFRKIQLPIDILFPLEKPDGVKMTTHVRNLQQRLSEMCQKMTEYQRTSFARDNQRYQRRSEMPFQKGDKCYYFLASSQANLSRKLQKHWIGPFEVRRVVSEALVVIYPVGHWCKRPKEVPAIVNRLRKVKLDTPLVLQEEETDDFELDELIHDVDRAAEHVTYSGTRPGQHPDDVDGADDSGDEPPAPLDPYSDENDEDDLPQDDLPAGGESDSYSDTTEAELQLEDDNGSEGTVMESHGELGDLDVSAGGTPSPPSTPAPPATAEPTPSTSTAPLPTPRASRTAKTTGKRVRFRDEDSPSPPRVRQRLPRAAKVETEMRALQEKINKPTKANKQGPQKKSKR